MVSTMLLEQVERLIPSELVELVELHDAIQAKLDDDVRFSPCNTLAAGTRKPPDDPGVFSW